MAPSSKRRVVLRFLSRQLLTLLASFALGLAIIGFLVGLTQQNTLLVSLAIILVVIAFAAFLSAPYAEASRLVEQARTLILAAQFNEALILLNRAIDFAPRLVSAHTSRSAAYAGRGQFDLALDDADHAIKLAPHAPEPRLVRARLYNHQQHYDDAIYDLRIGTRTNPHWATGYLELMQLYLRVKDYESCLAVLRDLTTKHFSDQIRYDALIMSGWVYEDKLHDPDKAIAAYTQAIPLLPDRKIGYLRRAFAYKVRGDKFQAAEDLLRAAQRKPTPEDGGRYYWMRAACYWGRYTITDDQRDFKAWVTALEQSIHEDSPAFGTQAREWLKALREQRLNRDAVTNALPSIIQIFPN